MNTHSLKLGILLSMLLLTTCNNKVKNEQIDDTGKEIAVSESKPIELADPTIFYWDNTYYLYGTGGKKDHGFLVYTSTDLINWEGPKGVNSGYALVTGESYGTKGFWAPQIFQYNDKLYMAYTANEQIAIAESDSPLGPFKQKTLAKLSGGERQIDPYVFIDDDGKIFLYHVRLTEGNKLFVAEMKDDLSDIKPGTDKLCIEAELPWEDTQNVEWKVTEGPTILKQDGLYYFFYSANDFRNIDYAVGYAVADNPYGPWNKTDDNPIIHRSQIGLNGSGHGDFFKDKDGKWKYVFHVHASDDNVSPRKTAIMNAEFVEDASGHDKMVMDYESVSYLYN
ncbi:MAG: glycoside hydrolase family 43 protein [Tannerella sp.]|nr:glycoside hydrolase family 43 protein [Tannerella sp.]